MRFFILAAMCVLLLAVPLMPRLGQTATDQAAAAASPGCGKLTLGSMSGDTGAAAKSKEQEDLDARAAAERLAAAAGELPSQDAGQPAATNCQDDKDCDGVPDAQDEYPDYDNRIDTDGDNVPDVSDNCIATANPDQLDSNGDGFGDACPDELQKYCESNPGEC